MSKNTDFIRIAYDYLTTLLDLEGEIIPLSKNLKKNLPIVVSANYNLFQVKYLGHLVVLVFCDNDESATPASLRKHALLIERVCNAPVVFVFASLVAYRVQRLIAARVNFIVPGQQMYIPSLFVDVRKPQTIDADLSQDMPALAQCILLHHIQVGSLCGASAKALSQLFSVSYATANRAIRWLEAHDLLTTSRASEREKIISLDSGKDVWQRALPLFVSPVDKVVYTDDCCDAFPLSGINALSEYTMINPIGQLVVALSREQLRKSNIATNPLYGDTMVEVWKYPPLLLSTDGRIDCLSLYLAHRADTDERIQMELDNMINNMIW